MFKNNVTYEKLQNTNNNIFIFVCIDIYIKHGGNTLPSVQHMLLYSKG